MNKKLYSLVCILFSFSSFSQGEGYPKWENFYQSDLCAQDLYNEEKDRYHVDSTARGVLFAIGIQAFYGEEEFFSECELNLAEIQVNDFRPGLVQNAWELLDRSFELDKISFSYQCSGNRSGTGSCKVAWLFNREQLNEAWKHKMVFRGCDFVDQDGNELTKGWDTSRSQYILSDYKMAAYN